MSLSLKPFNGLIHSFMADTPPRSDTVEPVVWGQLLGTSLTNSDPWSVVMTYPAKMPENFLGIKLLSAGLVPCVCWLEEHFGTQWNSFSFEAFTSHSLPRGFTICFDILDVEIVHDAVQGTSPALRRYSARSSEVETVFITC